MNDARHGDNPSAFWVSGIWFELTLKSALAGSEVWVTVDNRAHPGRVIRDVVVDLFAIEVQCERGDVTLCDRLSLDRLEPLRTHEFCHRLKPQEHLGDAWNIIIFGMLSGVDGRSGEQLVEPIAFGSDDVFTGPHLLKMPGAMATKHPLWARALADRSV